MPEVAQLPGKTPPHLLRFAFTPENARQMQAKAAEARRLRNNPMAQITLVAGDDYQKHRIARVREQLNRIDAMLLAEDDAQQIERLSRAACALSVELRKMLGIPDPGSRRPSSDRPAGRAPGAWLSEPTAAPACVPEPPTGSVPTIERLPETPQEQAKP